MTVKWWWLLVVWLTMAGLGAGMAKITDPKDTPAVFWLSVATGPVAFGMSLGNLIKDRS